MLQRDFKTLISKHYDLVVIGAGIYGAGVAREAAQRGLKVCLLEKGDFGAATSTGCFKIIHGGVRYLQQLAIGQLRESVNEQRILRKIAPNFVHPFPFLIPCYSSMKRSKFVLSIGMALYELLTLDRNKGVSASHHLPSFRSLSKEECLEWAPGINPKGLKGGIVFYDCQLSNCERFSYSVARSAHELGAQVINYTQVTKLNSEGRKLTSVSVEDVISGEVADISADNFVLAAGPWNRTILNEKRERLYSKGVQLVLPEMLKSGAVALESAHSYDSKLVSRGGRSYFLVPWRGHTLVGTADYDYRGEPDSYTISEDEADTFFEEVEQCYRCDFKKEDIKFVWGGLRPVAGASSDGSSPLATQTLLNDRKHFENLITVEGVKYTTFRQTAFKVLDLLNTETCGEGGPLFGSEIDDYSVYLALAQKDCADVLESAQVERLLRNFGTVTYEIANLIREDPELGDEIALGVLKAEIVYALRNEMVEHLTDLVLRRTELGTLGFPGNEAICNVLKLAASERGWSEERQVLEKEKLVQTYQLA